MPYPWFQTELRNYSLQSYCSKKRHSWLFLVVCDSLCSCQHMELQLSDIRPIVECPLSHITLTVSGHQPRQDECWADPLTYASYPALHLSFLIEGKAMKNCWDSDNRGDVVSLLLNGGMVTSRAKSPPLWTASSLLNSADVRSHVKESERTKCVGWRTGTHKAMLR